MSSIKITNLVKFFTIILLNRGPKHGYKIIKELETYFGKDISASHVYPFLNLLEKNKLIVNRKVEARDKKKYFITSKGRKFTKEILLRFNGIIDSLVVSKVKKCTHCRCEIYRNGYEKKNGNRMLIFCCEACSKH